jgi:cytochrome P450
MHSCVGKQLALNEMRLVLAQTVLRTEIVLGESYDDERWREEGREFFLLEVGPTPLKFKLRT